MVDRCTVFEVDEEQEDGTLATITRVAFGDGEFLPYRSFILKSVFDLATPYLLSPESTVTALDGRKLSGVIGAMLARQSRIPGTVVDVLVNEFLVKTPEEAATLGLNVGELNTKKLEGIIERILIQYGDDSVQELETATVLFNSVSNLAAKIIEDRRLGGFIEQSSRYVYYDERDPVTGRYMYLREQRIMQSAEGEHYVRTMDSCFALYAELIEALSTHYRTLKPIDEARYAIRPNDKTAFARAELTDPKELKEFDRVYKFDLKSRACDVARVVLPASTITNLAMVANGRTFEHLLKRLYSSGNPEFTDIGARLHATLNQVIPKYVKRAETTGVAYEMETTVRTRAQIAERFPELLSHHPSAKEVVRIEMPRFTDTEAPAHQLAAAYFPFVAVSYDEIMVRLRPIHPTTITNLLKEILGVRSGRRDRAARSFEHGYPCTFEIVGNFGVFRDLHRHRMLTQQRQQLNPHLGFTVPPDIEACGLADRVRALAIEVGNLYERLVAAVGREAAQYCVLFGHHIRFMMGYNLREAQHFLELRTVPQGHVDYRRIAKLMADEIEQAAPWVASIGLLSHVDRNDYPWARAAAEARQSAKRLEKGLTD